jgi:hypothetical protein
MTTTCVTCEHFTMKPRTGEAQAHLTASDVAHAKVGMGRCAIETISLRWISPETIACAKHAAITDEKAAGRREWIKGRARLQHDSHSGARDYRAEDE